MDSGMQTKRYGLVGTGRCLCVKEDRGPGDLAGGRRVLRLSGEESLKAEKKRSCSMMAKSRCLALDNKSNHCLKSPLLPCLLSV